MKTSEMWEILVPTEKRLKPDVGSPYYSTRYHKVWDAEIRKIAGGLTVLSPAKGQWISNDGVLFKERMIPVRIICTQDQIETIIEHTLKYYDQLAVLAYKISSEVILKHRGDSK